LFYEGSSNETQSRIVLSEAVSKVKKVTKNIPVPGHGGP
jgi:hypothetical protein